MVLLGSLTALLTFRHSTRHLLRVQWDIVKSVVKSVAGFQGRKFKVCSVLLKMWFKTAPVVRSFADLLLLLLLPLLQSACFALMHSPPLLCSSFLLTLLSLAVYALHSAAGCPSFASLPLQELLPEGFPGEDGDGGGRRKPGLFAQLQALGKGGRGKDAAAAAAGPEEAAPSGEDLRAQYKRRMLFGHMALPSPTPGPSAGASAAAEAASGAAVSGGTAGDSPVRGAAAAAQPVQPLAAQDGGSDGSPSAAAQAAQPVTPGTLALQSAVPSGGVFSQGDTGPAPDDAARSGKVFAVPSGPLAAGISSPAAPRFSPGPLASGTHGAGAAPLASTAAFGSIGSIAVAEPEGAAAADGEDGSGGGGGGTDSAAAAAALFGQAPDQRGSHHLQTPRWAAKLASKAQKGLHKLRDSLQD
jgi:hypothetical protein